MAIMKTILSRLKKFFIVLFTILKKPFCCRKRSRRNSGQLLPTTVDKSVTSGHSFNPYQPLNTGRTNCPQNQNFGQSTANSFNSGINSQIPVNNFTNNVEDNSNEPEVDFFKDMVPEFKKPKKVSDCNSILYLSSD